MKSFTLFGLVLFMLIQSCASPGKQVTLKPFMGRIFGEQELNKIDSVDRVEVFRLEPSLDHWKLSLQGTWAGPHRAMKSAFKPSKAWLTRLKLLVVDPRSYLWTLDKDCGPEPGIMVRFHNDDDWTDILFCFACDMLSIGKTQGASSIGDLESITWEDFDPSRHAFLSLAKEAFPSDEIIQAIPRYPEGPPAKRSTDIEEWDDSWLVPKASVALIPDIRIKELGIEACLSLTLGEALDEKGEGLGEDSHAHIFDLIMNGKFQRTPIPAPADELAIIINFPAIEHLAIPAHQIQVSNTLGEFGIARLDGTRPVQWWKAYEALPFWDEFLRVDLDRASPFKAHQPMDPDLGIWRDRFMIELDSIAPKLKEVLTVELIEDFLAARIARLKNHPGSTEEYTTFTTPSFVRIQRTLLVPSALNPREASKGMILPVIKREIRFFAPMTDNPPVVLRVADAHFSLAFDEADYIWHHQPHTAANLLALINRLLSNH